MLWLHYIVWSSRNFHFLAHFCHFVAPFLQMDNSHLSSGLSLGFTSLVSYFDSLTPDWVSCLDSSYLFLWFSIIFLLIYIHAILLAYVLVCPYNPLNFFRVGTKSCSFLDPHLLEECPWGWVGTTWLFVINGLWLTNTQPKQNTITWF